MHIVVEPKIELGAHHMKLKSLTHKQLLFAISHIKDTGITDENLKELGDSTQQSMTRVRGCLARYYHTEQKTLYEKQLKTLKQTMGGTYKDRLVKLLSYILDIKPEQPFRNEKKSSLKDNLRKWQQMWDKRKQVGVLLLALMLLLLLHIPTVLFHLVPSSCCLSPPPSSSSSSS
eukprot:4183369-Pyramimonas_sp.AAC.1